MIVASIAITAYHGLPIEAKMNADAIQTFVQIAAASLLSFISRRSGRQIMVTIHLGRADGGSGLRTLCRFVNHFFLSSSMASATEYDVLATSSVFQTFPLRAKNPCIAAAAK